MLIGGEVAEAYDTREALKRDTWLIVPIGLGLILLILIVLLRAIVMPLYVIGTVILSFGFALGVSSWIFTHVMDQPGSDRNLEQFAFIFLVALGVDYNVFLLARIREERERLPDTKAATVAALERTGGVITSAGLVLAATFSVLMALPLESLFQVGFVVASACSPTRSSCAHCSSRRSPCCSASTTGGLAADGDPGALGRVRGCPRGRARRPGRGNGRRGRCARSPCWLLAGASTRRVLTTRLPRMSLIVTRPASDSRNRTRAPRATRETRTALNAGAVSSSTSSVVGAGESFGNGCSLSGGGGGGGRVADA